MSDKSLSKRYLGVGTTVVGHKGRPRVQPDQVHVALLGIVHDEGVDGEHAEHLVALLLGEVLARVGGK